MKTSIATVSLSGNLTGKLAAIAGAGFDGIEIFEQDFIASDHSPAEVGQMVRDHGLEITLFQPFRDFEGLPEPYRARAFARAARTTSATRLAEAADIVIMTNTMDSIIRLIRMFMQ